jgi:hypothetical protein
MNEPPIRYDFFHDNGFSPVFECRDGDYVLNSEYNKIDMRLSRMRWENEKLKDLILQLKRTTGRC